jgi:acyl-CoA synthetase (NDP forming)
MTPADSMEFLARAGFPLTRFRRAGTEDETVAAARGIGFPVAVKMNSADVTHKSDAGGVFLDVADDAGVRAAFRAIRAAEGRLGARAGGALVCAMAPSGHEVIVGVTKDSQFGHAVMFGLGGIFVEVMKDVSFRVAPLSEKDAVEMIREIRGYRALTGLRGKPAGDLDALRKLLMQLTAFLASHPEIEEMDLNPVIVHERGLSIADARVVVRG